MIAFTSSRKDFHSVTIEFQTFKIEFVVHLHGLNRLYYALDANLDNQDGASLTSNHFDFDGCINSLDTGLLCWLPYGDYQAVKKDLEAWLPGDLS